MKGAKRGNEIREKADINTTILHKNFPTIENIYFSTIFYSFILKNPKYFRTFLLDKYHFVFVA